MSPRQRFTLRDTRRMVPMRFSTGFVVASDRRNVAGNVEDEGYGNYPLDDVDGWSSGVQRTNLTIDTQHHASVLVSWRALGRGRDDSSLSILFGGSYMRGKQADCFASEGPVVRIPTPADWPSGTSESVVFRQELTPEERSRCGAGVDYTRTYQWIRSCRKWGRRWTCLSGRGSSSAPVCGWCSPKWSSESG